MSLENCFENIPDELKAKAKECETSDELVHLVETEGIELTDEQLEAISGGTIWGD